MRVSPVPFCPFLYSCVRNATIFPTSSGGCIPSPPPLLPHLADALQRRLGNLTGLRRDLSSFAVLHPGLLLHLRLRLLPLRRAVRLGRLAIVEHLVVLAPLRLLVAAGESGVPSLRGVDHQAAVAALPLPEALLPHLQLIGIGMKKTASDVAADDHGTVASGAAAATAERGRGSDAARGDHRERCHADEILYTRAN